MLRIHDFDRNEAFCRQVTFAALHQIIPQSLVETAVEIHGVEEQRTRKLPATLVVWLCILMQVFSQQGLVSVLQRIIRGTRLTGLCALTVAANRSSISKARYRLGPEPLHWLFTQVCRPLATPASRGAFRYGLRLVAFDGTVELVADTPANEAAFGRQPPTGKTAGSAFPQVRCVYACECGTHAIFDAVLLPYRVGELTGVSQLLRAVEADMLVMLDAGLHSFDLVSGIVARGAQLLSRVRSNIRPPVDIVLADGSYLGWIRPSDPKRRRAGERRLVRVLEYTIDDPDRPHHGEVHRLITTLLDVQQYPSLELIVLYHERWEIELTIDEIDTHQRLSETVLRSHKPEGILQELYGLLLAHYCIRAWMHAAGLLTDTDPDRLSFVQAVRLIADAVNDFQTFAASAHPLLLRRLLLDLAAARLPVRENRINPRVVKLQRSKFNVKRPHHRCPPRPKPFRDALALVPATARP